MLITGTQDTPPYWSFKREKINIWTPKHISRFLWIPSIALVLKTDVGQ